MKTASAPKPTTTPPAPAKPGGIKKVNLGGVTAAQPKKGAKEYPVLPDPDGAVGRLVAQLADDLEQFDALEGSIAISKSELRALAGPFYFEHTDGLHEFPSSVTARGTAMSEEDIEAKVEALEAQTAALRAQIGAPSDPREILISFQNRYTPTSDDAAIVELLGEDRAGRFFRQKFDLKITGDSIPAAALEANENGVPIIIAELQELFEKHDAGAALSAKAIIAPTADFHAARHSQLTVDENLEIERIVPIIAQVKGKGRKKAA